MLTSLHQQNKLVKIPTDQIEMIPNTMQRIKLSELNQIIAEQRGVAVNDLALQDPNSIKPTTEIQDIAQVEELPATISDEIVDLDALSLEDKAKKLRGQADKLSKQAAELRRQAEELVPIKKNARKKAE
ncbi:MAG: hypothetical protein EBS49_08300 [Verrucomicrobia bacterium]|nr:hypothetical protein [Verrucomicrobiota bacterium]